jgi:hypothetical protein
VSLLEELGYQNLRVFPGGMAEWSESKGPIERGPAGVPHAASLPQPPTPGSPRAPVVTLARMSARVLLLIDLLAARSVGEILSAWLAMILTIGIAYWCIALAGVTALLEGGVPVSGRWDGFVTAIYFSFVTALSVGYGDIAPVGLARGLAVVEAASGLLIFGFIVSKFLSRRQDELIGEIHRITFEERLERVQTNLHLVLSALQQLSEDCAAENATARSLARVESTVLVFAGELRTIHDLLYRPQSSPDEEVLEAILANLSAAFGELAELVTCVPDARSRSAVLDANLRAIARLGSDICGECVPREHAPALKLWMDRIQVLSRGLLGERS